MENHPERILSDILDLVRNVARTLDVNLPETLFEFGQDSRQEHDWYLIGLIGGKEVGKSALVNALVGEQITESTSYGPGTEQVVAYVHRDRSKSVSEFLHSEVPGRYEIIEHNQASLNRQVLLDLPDIDSHYASHSETVRKLLRFILFPVWIQSVEKYADRQPMELLRKVVQGNAPQNFLYCLNKVDQIERIADKGALSELAEDYQSRLSRSLGIANGVRVYLISAIEPKRFDLPALSGILSKQKEENEIAASRILATRQYGASLLKWLNAQDLSGRTERLVRMEDQLTTWLNHRIERPLTETLIPSIRRDPRLEGYLCHESFRARIQRWPLVRWVETLTGPTKRWLHLGSPTGWVGGRNLSKPIVEEAFAAFDPPLAQSLQACFAQCRGSFSQIGETYRHLPLWDACQANARLAELKGQLRDSLSSFLESAVEVLTSKSNPFGMFYRVLVSFGALVWFPFGQPVLQHYLENGSFAELPLLIVRLLGVASLLSSALFLVLFFGMVWLAVRFRAKRSVERILKSPTLTEPTSEKSLEACAREWGRSLIRPLEEEKTQLLGFEMERRRLETELSRAG